jgi:hypothetical protein
MTLKLCIDDLVMRGCDDWIQAAEVASVAIEVGGAQSRDRIRELSLQMIRHVVEQGLMELGDVDVAGEWESKEGFRKWNLATQEGLGRVEREWNALGRNPNLWEVCWLRNTEKGNQFGERLFKERDASR